jgi:hypothetical protein
MTLWLSPDDRSLFAPVAVGGLQVAEDGEILGPPVLGLAFRNDPERVDNPTAKLAYFNTLFLPAVMTLAMLACKSTTTAHNVLPAALQQARRKRKKRPFVPYHAVDFKPMADTLRFQGQSGIAGLASAMRTCRHHFVQDLRGGSSTILIVGNG